MLWLADQLRPCFTLLNCFCNSIICKVVVTIIFANMLPFENCGHDEPIQIFVCRKHCLEEVLSNIEETESLKSAEVFLYFPNNGKEK